MNPSDHGPPHFHARAGDRQMRVRIEELRIDKGRLSRREMRDVMRWAQEHQPELRRAWEQASLGVHPDRID